MKTNKELPAEEVERLPTRIFSLEYNPDFPAPPLKELETFTASRHETRCPFLRTTINPTSTPAIVRREFINLDVDAYVHSLATEMNGSVSSTRSRVICQITLVCSKLS